ncbi:peptidoglycan DD-metalloendopeptidase family protein [Enterococcus faecium]|nr:peptidoglycan DD-metalloendopeptidase family protein [Enterococcus faecium]MDQ8448374.1 peptidoglycan DD-metalloendopeptidase family protein [Enterococcus faecium]
MKKTSKLLSSVLLLSQVLGCITTVSADEHQSIVSTEQVTTPSNQETIQSTTTTEENNIVDSTNESESSSENSKPIETDKEESETTNSEITESNQTSQIEEKPEKNPVENKPIQESQQITTDSTSNKDNSEIHDVQDQNTSADLSNSQSTPFYQIFEPSTQQQTYDDSQNVSLNDSLNESSIQDAGSSVSQIIEKNIYFEKDKSVESFIRKIGESARKIGQKHDLYASVMIAQAILESANGQSELAKAPNYNLFGIKGTHNGNGVTFNTQEDLGNGNLYTIKATFKKYKNYEDCLNDYAQLLKEGITGNKQFYSGVWKTNAKTYQEATRFLTGRYATDTKYNQKLNSLIDTYDLTEFDKKESEIEVNKKGYIIPLKNYTISSLFGEREGEFHRGLDLAASQGEPIYASKAGTVIKAEYHPSWGNVVVIQHEDGTTSLYAHQQEYQVKVDDTVKQGEVIGYVGSTGNSTGSHLHYEICNDNSLSQSQLIDPKEVLF